MPSFNFAAEPDDDRINPLKKEEPREPVQEHQEIAQELNNRPEEHVVPGAPSSIGRSIPFDEAVPSAYRQQPIQRYSIPASDTGEDVPEEIVPEMEQVGIWSELVPQHDTVPILAESATDSEDAATPKLESEAQHSTQQAAQQEQNRHKEMSTETSEDFDNPFSGLNYDEYLTNDEETGGNNSSGKHSKLPLIGIAAIVLLLISASVVWFLNPYPPLREALDGFFRSPQQSTTPEDGSDIVPAQSNAITDSLAEPEGPARDWNYYLQISSFRELYKAQNDANRLRKLGLNAKVEGEFIPGQRRTYYRVRLGPYSSVAIAAGKSDSLKGIIPATAFLDSIRIEADAVSIADNDQPLMQPVLKSPPRQTQPGQQGTASSREAKPPEPNPATAAAAGFAVHVSSFNDLSKAQEESGALIGRGLPAFTSKSVVQGTAWYRVLVGPFRTQKEAERYLEIVQKEFGNTAYVRSLGK